MTLLVSITEFFKKKYYIVHSHAYYIPFKFAGKFLYFKTSSKQFIVFLLNVSILETILRIAVCYFLEENFCQELTTNTTTLF